MGVLVPADLAAARLNCLVSTWRGTWIDMQQIA
jgi:hypothetical protein